MAPQTLQHFHQSYWPLVCKNGLIRIDLEIFPLYGRDRDQRALGTRLPQQFSHSLHFVARESVAEHRHVVCAAGYFGDCIWQSGRDTYLEPALPKELGPVQRQLALFAEQKHAIAGHLTTFAAAPVGSRAVRFSIGERVVIPGQDVEA